MPTVRSGFQIKTFRDVMLGELLVYGDGDRGAKRIAFVAEVADIHGPILVALKDADEPHPRLIQPGGNDSCLSLGVDWVLEPIADDFSYPRAFRPRTMAGQVAFDGNAWWLQVATSGVDEQGRFNSEWRNIETGMAARRIADTSVTFARWQIWQSDGERSDPRGQPVFEYTAQIVPVRR